MRNRRRTPRRCADKSPRFGVGAQAETLYMPGGAISRALSDIAPIKGIAIAVSVRPTEGDAIAPASAGRDGDGAPVVLT